MFRTILVPLDGSPAAERALPLAAALAHAADARLVLVRCAWTTGVPGWETEQRQEAATREAQDYLHPIAGELRLQGVRVDIRAITAHPDQGILWTLADEHADLVVMTTHGRTGVGRFIYGSVAEAVLTQSHVPVLLVRAASLVQPSLDPGRDGLLVPLDGSAVAEAVLPYAVEMARVLDATLILVRAVPLPSLLTPERLVEPALGNEIFKMELQEAEDYLGRLARKLRQDGRRVLTYVETGGVASTILRKSDELNTVFILMATHGRSGMDRLFFGSVAMEVLRRGDHPVMLVRPLGLIRDQAPAHARVPAGMD